MPVEPPIQNPGDFDILAVRKDGGIDAVIIAATPIDGSPETLNALSVKVRNYITELNSPEFQTEHPRTSSGEVRILIHCRAAVDETARGLMKSLAQEALRSGIVLKVVDLVT
jgi:hypothetical protein